MVQNFIRGTHSSVTIMQSAKRAMELFSIDAIPVGRVKSRMMTQLIDQILVARVGRRVIAVLER